MYSGVVQQRIPKNMCFEKHQNGCSKYDNHSRCENQHDRGGGGGGLYDRDIHMSSENYEGRGHGLDLDEHGFCVLGEVG